MNELENAKLLRRFLSLIVDICVIWLITAFINHALSLTSTTNYTIIFNTVCCFLGLYFYVFMRMHSKIKQATFGGLDQKIIIVDKNNNKISAKRNFLRGLLFTLNWLISISLSVYFSRYLTDPFISLLAFFMTLLSLFLIPYFLINKGQLSHDYLSGTFVKKGKIQIEKVKVVS